MPSLVTELDLLRRALDAEAMLRDEAFTEFAHGEQHGPMRVAHDQSVQNCIDAAKALVVASARA